MSLMYVPRLDAPSNRTSTSPFPFLAPTEMPNSPSSGRTHKKSPLAQRPVLNPANPPLLPPGWAVCSPRQLATNCRLARELACPIYTVPWLIKAVKPGLLHRLGTGQGPAILQALWVEDKGHGGLHGWDITVPQLQNSSTRNSRTHLYVLFPRNHADPLRPLERRQLRICQEDGKVRYAARALTDSRTAKDFPYRGGDTRWRHWWSFCSFALTIMYWFALRNLPCFFLRNSDGALSSQGDPSEPAITTESNVVGDTPRTQELHSCHWAYNGYEPSSNHDI